jgi:DNA modification methylase
VSGTATLLSGDALTVLQSLPDGAARCCVTSPPYWGLRDYGVDGQLGLEPTPEQYVTRMVAVFREVRRVLADDGTLWLNVGDSYAGSGRGIGDTKTTNRRNPHSHHLHERLEAEGAVGRQWVKPPDGYERKNLVGIPWRLAFALQADGWTLRSDVIWAKPNPMPESVTDRPTKAHEYVFLLSKSARYFYDAEGIAEPIAESTAERLAQPTLATQRGSDRVPGKTNGRMKAVPPRFHATRNARSIWTIATQGYSGAHFATMPPELARRCILAGSAPGDTVLDPFGGSGTTAATAIGLGRNALHIDLNPAYLTLARERIGPMFCTGAA